MRADTTHAAEDARALRPDRMSRSAAPMALREPRARSSWPKPTAATSVSRHIDQRQSHTFPNPNAFSVTPSLTPSPGLRQPGLGLLKRLDRSVDWVPRESGPGSKKPARAENHHDNFPCRPEPARPCVSNRSIRSGRRFRLTRLRCGSRHGDYDLIWRRFGGGPRTVPWHLQRVKVIGRHE